VSEPPVGWSVWAGPPPAVREEMPEPTDDVGRALVARGLPADAGLPVLLAFERADVLRRLYRRLAKLADGHTRGSWNQAASLVSRMVGGEH